MDLKVCGDDDKVAVQVNSFLATVWIGRKEVQLNHSMVPFQTSGVHRPGIRSHAIQCFEWV